ncbi:MAG: 50S ribosomal protein L11 methyltransferase, partial [Prevotella sp.]|nr:50S ribosomal protein L11 methyltransferase [Prevotella sp.]
VLSHVDGMFDVIVANINRNILLDDMPTIVETMSPDGCLILSGFYEEDAALLVEKAETLGLRESHRTVDNNWTMLAFKRG